MTDIARLILEADTRGLKQGEKALNDVSAASKRAAGDTTRAASDMSKGFSAAGSSSVNASKGVDKLTNSMGQSTRASIQSVAQNDKLAAAFMRMDQAIESFALDQAQATNEINRAKTALDAGQISLSQYNAEVLRTKAGLSILQQEYNEASRELTRLNQATGQATVSAGSQRAGLQQLGFQLGDVATMYSLGARPMQIFATQSGQIVQAVQLMTGGTSRFAAFLSGPWGIALTVGAIALTPLISKLFEAEDALKSVDFASSALGDAQGILADVMDLTTGKINTQSSALLGLAKAQAIAGRIGAQQRGAAARAGLADEAAIRTVISGGFGGGLSLKRGRDASGDIASALLDGSLNTREAVAGLESLRKTGLLTEEKFLELAQAVTSFGVEAENVKVFEELEKALNGDAKAFEIFREAAGGAKKSVKELSEAQRELSGLLDRLLEPERAIAQRNKEFDILAREIAKAEAAGAKAVPQLRELEAALEALRQEGISSAPIEITALNSFRDGSKSLLIDLGDGFNDIASDFAKDVARSIEQEAQLRTAFSNTFADGMMAALDGNLRSFLRSFFSSVLSGAFQQIGAGLFSSSGGGGGLLGSVFKGLVGATTGTTTGGGVSFGGARANGGQVDAGKAYLVGERRPELFIPRGAGTIHPSPATGGRLNVTITMDQSTGSLGAFVRDEAGRLVAESAPMIVAAAEGRTVRTLQRPRLAGLAR